MIPEPEPLTEEDCIALLHLPDGCFCMGDNLRVSGPCGLHANGYAQDDDTWWVGCDECLTIAKGKEGYFIA